MSTAVLSPPTHEDLTRQLRELEQAMYLYNPSSEWVIREHGGRPFYLVPDRGGEVVAHPAFKDAEGRPEMVVADGRTGIKSLHGGRKYEKGHSTEQGALEGQSAWEIVKYFAEHFSKWGIIYLKGDPTTDAPRMKAAKLAYRDNIREWALEQTQARAEFVANWRKQPGNKNSARMPPPPTAIQIQAQEILDEVGSETRTTATFVCRTCFQYETADWEKFRRHLAAAHQIENAKREDYDSAVAGPAEVEPDDDDEEDDDQAPAAARGKAQQKRKGR